MKRGDFEFSDFWARRIRRIFPALLTVTFATLIAGWWYLLPAEFETLKSHIKWGLAFAANFKLNSEVGYFDVAAELKPLLHLWSLAIEEQFYVVWPVLLWICFRNKLNLFTVTLVLGFLSYQSRKHFGTTASESFYFPWTRFWELQAGALLALWNAEYAHRFSEMWNRLEKYIRPFVLSADASKEGHTTTPLVKSAISLVGFALVVWSCWSFTKATPFPSRFTIYPVLGSVLIIAAGKDAWFNKWILSLRPMKFIGNISFPLYLWHWPILSFARIILGEPTFKVAAVAVALSFVLSVLTYFFVEQKLRFNTGRFAWKAPALAAGLCGIVLILNLVGINPKSAAYGIDKKVFEHATGASNSWYQGKDDWLFLGNAYENSVAKLRLALTPDDSQLKSTHDTFFNIALEAAKANSQIALVIGPNKESIYGEYLPDVFVPSTRRYIAFFTNRLREISNLKVYDPTNDLITSKDSEGILYWRTDTHWNNRGAFVAYKGFSKMLNLPVPKVEFKQSKTHPGDLIGISQLKDFPLRQDDNWDVIWKDEPKWMESELGVEQGQETSFGKAQLIRNERPLIDKSIWVIGDSFTSALKQYFNATFKEVRFLGHWGQELTNLPAKLRTSDRKPDFLVIVRVERSF